MDIEQRFLDEARREIEAENERKLMQQVRVRAAVLQQKARDLETSDLRDPLTRIREMEARLKTLQEAKQRAHPGVLSAADDDELSRLPAKIAELTKAARMAGLLPRTAA
jgi:hypothetical protein